MFMITYIATNNDTHKTQEFVLRQCTNSKEEQKELAENELKYEMFFKRFKEIPHDIKNRVINTFDGVWEPDVDTIKVFKVEEV